MTDDRTQQIPPQTDTDLPPGWVGQRLGQLVEIKYGKNLPTKEFVDEGYPVFGANGIIGYHTDFLYEDEQVLISCRGANSGTINWSPAKCFITNNSLILELSSNPAVLKKYLFFALHAADRTKIVTGTAQPQVTINNAIELFVPLAPLPEQRRIVEAIETQFTRLDAAVAGLERLRTNLNRYRQSVLKAACEGRLVPTEAALAQADGRSYEDGPTLLARILAERCQAWAVENPKKKYKEPTAPDVDGLPEVPAGWAWASLDQCFSVQRGRFSIRPRNDPRYYDGPHPFVQIGDLPRDGGAITAYSSTLNESGLKASRKFPAGTVLIAIVGATIGNTGYLSFDGCCPDSLVALSSDRQMMLRFAEFYMQSRKLSIRQASYASGGQPNINLAFLQPYPFPLPPLAEQQRIVEEVERRLSVVDQHERVIEASLRRAARLRQAILKRAFSGRLV